MIAAIVILLIIAYTIGAGIARGYANVKFSGDWISYDDVKRTFTTLLWPLALIFLPISELTTNTINNQATKKLKKNKKKIEDIKQIRIQLEESEEELKAAEEELERELQQR